MLTSSPVGRGMRVCALPVGDIAHENSVLFLWATSPKLAECMQVIAAWGFTYRTASVWVKDKIGMGYHFREKHETLLVAKRGELPPPATDNRPDSVQFFPRLEHSAKPVEYYDIIDKMYPGIRKIELFQRDDQDFQPGPLWSTWGNQATRNRDPASSGQDFPQTSHRQHAHAAPCLDRRPGARAEA